MNIDTGRPITDILGSLVRQVTDLMRSEGQLARAEISEKIDKLTGAAMMMGAGAVLLIPALVILLQAAVTALVERGWNGSTAALIVGLGALTLGAVLCAVALSRFKAVSLVPNKTLHSLQQDVAVASETGKTP